MTHLWGFVHNAISHPLLACTFNSMWANRFHDYTARKAGFDKPPPGEIMNTKALRIMAEMIGPDQRSTTLVATAEQTLYMTGEIDRLTAFIEGRHAAVGGLLFDAARKEVAAQVARAPGEERRDPSEADYLVSVAHLVFDEAGIVPGTFMYRLVALSVKATRPADPNSPAFFAALYKQMNETGTPAAPAKCDHDWPQGDNGVDLNACCTKCGMSFQRYIYTECP